MKGISVCACAAWFRKKKRNIRTGFPKKGKQKCRAELWELRFPKHRADVLARRVWGSISGPIAAPKVGSGARSAPQHTSDCILRTVKREPRRGLFFSPDFVPVLGYFADVVEDTNTLMGPICSREESTAECFEGAGVQLGNAPCLIHGEAVGISQAPWHPEGGNPEVNSSRRDVRKELTVRASRGRQVSQQGQVPATPRMAGSQGLSGGTHASHA